MLSLPALRFLISVKRIRKNVLYMFIIMPYFLKLFSVLIISMFIFAILGVPLHYGTPAMPDAVGLFPHSSILFFFFALPCIGVRICRVITQNAPPLQFQLFLRGNQAEDRPNGSFATRQDAMLLLFQLLVGEGWHEVMYAACEIQGWSIAMFYIAYVMIVTVLVTNLVFGVILDAFQKTLEKEQEEEEEAAGVGSKNASRRLGLDRKSLRSRSMTNIQKATNGELSARHQNVRLYQEDLFSHQCQPTVAETESEATFGTGASGVWNSTGGTGTSESDGNSSRKRKKLTRTRSFGEEWLKHEKDTEWMMTRGSLRAEQKEGEHTSTIDSTPREERSMKLYEMGKINSTTDSRLSKESDGTTSERKTASEQREDIQVMAEDVEVEIV